MPFIKCKGGCGKSLFAMRPEEELSGYCEPCLEEKTGMTTDELHDLAFDQHYARVMGVPLNQIGRRLADES